MDSLGDEWFFFNSIRIDFNFNALQNKIYIHCLTSILLPGKTKVTEVMSIKNYLKIHGKLRLKCYWER
ncbi:hypothetical protein BpHYR1_021996 [Brachionus plicatilis]|uniref:Uncharacterized protein n=1 Tax=Brachionus plicatilis TaxID=10195 RepID=A0A3M7RF51_BRAPC|nr:hypothetical protein BpHYR1_021996 [Brachionus plicatilis]